MKHQKKFIPREEKTRCAGCGKAFITWRMDTCPNCGKKYCHPCFRDHMHNED